MKVTSLFFIALAGVALAAPAPNAEKAIVDPSQHFGFENLLPVFIDDSTSPASPLTRRNGWHYAQYYDQSNCNGNVVANYDGFGCGGVCNGFPAALSMRFVQQGSGNPRPSASNYYSGGCNGSGQSIPLQSATNACYNFGQQVRSSYLYWDC